MSTEDLSNVNSAEILAIMESGNVDVAEFDSLNLWERITREDWKKIFPRFPRFADKYQEGYTLAQQCKCWDWFNRSHWTSLLSAYPQFADKCTIWNDFTSWEWVRILLKQPQFADKCPASAFDEFTQCDWDNLEKKHPFVFEKQRLLSSLRKIADFNA